MDSEAGLELLLSEVNQAVNRSFSQPSLGGLKRPERRERPERSDHLPAQVELTLTDVTSYALAGMANLTAVRGGVHPTPEVVRTCTQRANPAPGRLLDGSKAPEAPFMADPLGNPLRLVCLLSLGAWQRGDSRPLISALRLTDALRSSLS